MLNLIIEGEYEEAAKLMESHLEWAEQATYEAMLSRD